MASKVLHGIDTSSHNGNITESILNQVDFVIIRLGFGEDMKEQDDKQFENTVSLCQKMNKPWGAYLYSYALKPDDVYSEYEHCKRVLNGRTAPLGLWFDMEDADGYKSKHGGVSKEDLVEICDRFCGNYGAGIYASLSWLRNQLDDEKLERYPKWVAQWNDSCDYTKPYKMWQYTNSCIIDGKRFDGNYLYIEENEQKKTIDEIAAEVLGGKWGNGSERKKRLAEAGYDYVTVQKKVNEIVNSVKDAMNKDGTYNPSEIAREVIKGKWGNGKERQKRLSEAGYDYILVQNEVNRILSGK